MQLLIGNMNYRKRLQRGLAVALVAGLSLGGCVTTSGSADNLTPEEQRMRAQADDFSDTVVQGAVVGAVAGGLLAILSGNKDNAAQFAALGAAAGGGAGYYVAKQKENYATEEARLDAMIGDVRKDNSRLAELTANAKTVIVSDMARIDKVEAQLAAGQITQQQAKAELARAEDNGKYLTSAIEGLKKRHEEYVKASAELAARNDVKVQNVKADRKSVV